MWVNRDKHRFNGAGREVTGDQFMMGQRGLSNPLGIILLENSSNNT